MENIQNINILQQYNKIKTLKQEINEIEQNARKQQEEKGIFYVIEYFKDITYSSVEFVQRDYIFIIKKQYSNFFLFVKIDDKNQIQQTDNPDGKQILKYKDYILLLTQKNHIYYTDGITIYNADYDLNGLVPVVLIESQRYRDYLIIQLNGGKRLLNIIDYRCHYLYLEGIEENYFPIDKENRFPEYIIINDQGCLVFYDNQFKFNYIVLSSEYQDMTIQRLRNYDHKIPTQMLRYIDRKFNQIYYQYYLAKGDYCIFDNKIYKFFPPDFKHICDIPIQQFKDLSGLDISNNHQYQCLSQKDSFFVTKFNQGKNFYFYIFNEKIIIDDKLQDLKLQYNQQQQCFVTESGSHEIYFRDTESKREIIKKQSKYGFIDKLGIIHARKDGSVQIFDYFDEQIDDSFKQVNLKQIKEFKLMNYKSQYSNQQFKQFKQTLKQNLQDLTSLAMNFKPKENPFFQGDQQKEMIKQQVNVFNKLTFDIKTIIECKCQVECEQCQQSKQCKYYDVYIEKMQQNIKQQKPESKKRLQSGLQQLDPEQEFKNTLSRIQQQYAREKICVYRGSCKICIPLMQELFKKDQIFMEHTIVKSIPDISQNYICYCDELIIGAQQRQMCCNNQRILCEKCIYAIEQNKYCIYCDKESDVY